MTYDAVCEICGSLEVRKSIHEPWPEKHSCGGALQRVYSIPAVHYNAPGFFNYDHGLRQHVSPQRYAQFEREKETILKAAHDGTLPQEAWDL